MRRTEGHSRLKRHSLVVNRIPSGFSERQFRAYFVPFFPVLGFVFPFVLQLLDLLWSGVERLCGAT